MKKHLLCILLSSSFLVQQLKADDLGIPTREFAFDPKGYAGINASRQLGLSLSAGIIVSKSFPLLLGFEAGKDGSIGSVGIGKVGYGAGGMMLSFMKTNAEPSGADAYSDYLGFEFGLSYMGSLKLGYFTKTSNGPSDEFFRLRLGLGF